MGQIARDMYSLEHLEAKSVPLNEQFMPVLSRALRITPHLQVLKLEDCALSGRPIIILVAALKINTALRELYLCDNDLGINDAIQLGALLRANCTLQLLDISNNDIQDSGAGHIADGVADQGDHTSSGAGLSVLVLWNNHLTRNSSTHFSRALARSRSLETLNIGHNSLSNEVLHVLKDSLQQNRSLLRLGMQSTHLTCEGAIALAEIIEDNPVIQRIDLRDNHILLAGLLALTLSMKNNTSVTQLDLDDAPKKRLPVDVEVEEYSRLVGEVRGYCARNESVPRPSDEEDEELSELSDSEIRASRRRMYPTSVNSRKISLTCQTLLRTVAQDNGMLLVEPRRSGGRLRSPAPSPVPSPVSSPMPSPAPSPGPARSRFRVSQVSESDSMSPSPSPNASPSTSPTCFFPSSRFKVTVVEPPVSVVVTNNVASVGFPEEAGKGGAVEPVAHPPGAEAKAADKQCTPEADIEVSRLMEGGLDRDLAHPRPHPRPIIATPHPLPLAQEGPSPVQPESAPSPPKSQLARARKISWVATNSLNMSADEQKALPSGLERLLGLFNNAGSLFNKNPNPSAPKPAPAPSRATGADEPVAAEAVEKNDNDESVLRIREGDKTDCDTLWQVCGEHSELRELRETPGNVGSEGYSAQRDILNNNNESECETQPGFDGALGEPASTRKDENLNIRRQPGRAEGRDGQDEGSECVQECVRVQVRLLSGAPRTADVCDKHDDLLLHTKIADISDQVRKDTEAEKVKVEMESSAVTVPTVPSAAPIPTSIAL